MHDAIYKPGEILIIDAASYLFSEHPSAPGLPYGQEGRRSIVYQLVAEDGNLHALKVFKPRYSVPRMVAVAEKLHYFEDLPGLHVCRRKVLTSSRHPELLADHPELAYAVLMPWIDGGTWQEYLLTGRVLTPPQSLALAHSFVSVLVSMEERGLAHCDLSGPNLIISPENEAVLIDLEEMYGPGFIQPEVISSGSSGYAHRSAPNGLWNAQADRFAGAVLLAEILSWCDERVRQAAWGESYFSLKDMQVRCDRYHLLTKVLGERWGEQIAGLFARAWSSDSLLDCPTFAVWNAALFKVSTNTIPKEKSNVQEQIPFVAEVSHTENSDNTNNILLEKEGWICPHCGKEVWENKEICPYCERSREAIIAPQTRTRRRIPFGGWIADGVVILSLLFASSIIIPPLFQPTLTPTSGTTQLPIVTPTQTQTRPLIPTLTVTLSPTSSPTPEPSQTPKPTLISSDTPTPLPIAVISAENANIRSGPGTIYPVVQMVTKGMNLTIIGRSQDSTWLVVVLDSSQQGWIALDLVEPGITIESLPVVDTPPTPTSTITSTPIPEWATVYNPADINRDCIVDVKDYNFMIAHWTGFDKYGPNYDARADLVDSNMKLGPDGYVNAADYNFLIINWGKKCEVRLK